MISMQIGWYDWFTKRLRCRLCNTKTFWYQYHYQRHHKKELKKWGAYGEAKLNIINKYYTK